MTGKEMQENQIQVARIIRVRISHILDPMDKLPPNRIKDMLTSLWRTLDVIIYENTYPKRNKYYYPR